MRLRCPAGTARCVGTVALRLGTTTLGTARYAIAAGRTATVRLVVRRTQRSRALKRRRLAVRIVPTGASASSRAVTLRRAAR